MNSTNNLEGLNRALFLAINGGPDSPLWVVALAKGIADDLILAIPLALVALWFWGDSARRSVALLSVIVTFLALGLNQLIGLLWQHPRPFMLGLGHTFLAHAADSSFPSDHMTVFASVGIVCLLGNVRWLGALILLGGLAVGWARVFLGLHFPLDMAGGVLVSVITYGVVAPIWARVRGAVTQLAESLYRRVFAWPISSGWVRG